MNDLRRGEISTETLAAYLEGEVTASEAEAVESELADSAAARRRLAGLQRVRAALSSSLPKLEVTDMVASVRRAIEAGGRPRARRPGWRWVAAASICLAAAAALAIVRTPDAEFHAKSATSAGATGVRWAGIQTYYLGSDGEPRRLVASLPRAAGLLFSYTNLGRRPFGFLMAFLVDARGEVRWCHPEYESPGSDPTSIPIRKGGAEVPLAELIHLAPAPGPATLHALFSDQPLHVSEVEAWLSEPHTLGETPWPNASHQTLEIMVEP